MERGARKPALRIPQELLDQRRWMVRPHTSGRAKLPQAARNEPPRNFDDRWTGGWRYDWDEPAVWVTGAEAIAFWAEYADEIAGLCFVLHPAGENERRPRYVCFDFDGAVDADGQVDPDVLALLEQLNTYVELSLSGRGLHAIVVIDCEPFKNVLHYPIGACKVDVLCSAQIAITGDVFRGWAELRTGDAEILDRFKPKLKTAGSDYLPDFWSEVNSGTRIDHEYLIERMHGWSPCIEGQSGDAIWPVRV